MASFEAPLEYWFFKLNVDGLAFLVDFIIRRAAGTAEVRVSYWLSGAGRVVRAVVPSPAASADGTRVSIAGCLLSADRSRGAVDGLGWDLELDPGPTFLDPRTPLLRRLRPLDMELVSWPRARITGSVRVADQLVRVEGTAAAITHYWGERLPSSWRWISASQFDGAPDCVLEAMVLRTRAWGLPWPKLRVGYFFLERAGERTLVVSPLDGLVRLDEDATGLQLAARRFGGPSTRLRLTATPDVTNDLGDGIRQTLLATCTFEDEAISSITCGLEWRD